MFHLQVFPGICAIVVKKHRSSIILGFHNVNPFDYAEGGAPRYLPHN